MNVKSHHVGIRMNAQQLQRLGELAAVTGLTQSALVRAAVETIHRDPALLLPATGPTNDKSGTTVVEARAAFV